MDRQKWFKEEEDLKKKDIVHFKLTDSPMSPDWRIGKVEFIKLSRDKKVREVGISYKSQDVGENNWKHNVVERPVRSVVKLWNIEDTDILETMKKVKDLVKEILSGKDLDSNVIVNDSLYTIDDYTDDLQKEEISSATHYHSLLSKFISNWNFSLQSSSVLNTDLSQGRMHSIQVTGKTVKWPKVIRDEEDIGMTTEALALGVTTLIASGFRVSSSDENHRTDYDDESDLIYLI